jgi:hypothetical protein
VNHANYQSRTNIDMPLSTHEVRDSPEVGHIDQYVPISLRLTADPSDPRARNLDAQFLGLATVTVQNTDSVARRLACGASRDRLAAITTIAPGDVASVTLPMFNVVEFWDNDPGTAAMGPLHVLAYTVLTIEVTDVYGSAS